MQLVRCAVDSIEEASFESSNAREPSKKKEVKNAGVIEIWNWKLEMEMEMKIWIKIPTSFHLYPIYG